MLTTCTILCKISYGYIQLGVYNQIEKANSVELKYNKEIEKSLCSRLEM